MSLNLAGIVLTGDLLWICVFQITHYSGTSLTLAMIPAPITLLAVAGFYLAIYLRSPAPAMVKATPDSREEISLTASYARGALLALHFQLLLRAQQFDERLFSAVALLKAGADNAQIAALAIAIARGATDVKEPLDGIVGRHELNQ